MTIGVPEVSVNNWYYGITKKEKVDAKSIKEWAKGAKVGKDPKDSKRTTSRKKPDLSYDDTPEEVREKWTRRERERKIHEQAVSDVKEGRSSHPDEKHLTPKQIKENRGRWSKEYADENKKLIEERERSPPEDEKDTEYHEILHTGRNDNVRDRVASEFGEGRVNEKNLKSRRERLRQQKRQEEDAEAEGKKQSEKDAEKRRSGQWKKDEKEVMSKRTVQRDTDPKYKEDKKYKERVEAQGKGEDYKQLDLKTQKEWAKRNQQFKDREKPPTKRQYPKVDPKHVVGNEHPVDRITHTDVSSPSRYQDTGAKDAKQARGEFSEEKEYEGDYMSKSLKNKLKALKIGLSLMGLIPLKKDDESSKLEAEIRRQGRLQTPEEKKIEAQAKIDKPTIYQQARTTNFGHKPESDRESEFYDLYRGHGKRRERVKPTNLERTHGSYRVGDKRITSTAEAKKIPHGVDTHSHRKREDEIARGEKDKKGETITEHTTHQYHKPASISTKKPTPKASHYNPNRKEGEPPQAKQEAYDEEERRKEIRANIKQRKESKGNTKTRNEIDTRKQIDGKDNPNYLKIVKRPDTTTITSRHPTYDEEKTSIGTKTGKKTFAGFTGSKRKEIPKESYTDRSIKDRQRMEDDKKFGGEKLTDAEEKLVKPKNTPSKREYLQGEGAKELHEEMGGEGRQLGEQARQSRQRTEEEAMEAFRKRAEDEKRKRQGKAPKWAKGGAKAKWEKADQKGRDAMEKKYRRSQAHKNKSIIELQGTRLRIIKTQQMMTADSPSPKRPTGNNQGFSGGFEGKPERPKGHHNVPTPKDGRHKEAFERERRIGDEVYQHPTRKKPKSNPSSPKHHRQDQRNQRELDQEFMRREPDEKFERGKKDRDRRRDRFGINP